MSDLKIVDEYWKSYKKKLESVNNTKLTINQSNIIKNAFYSGFSALATMISHLPKTPETKEMASKILACALKECEEYLYSKTETLH